MFPLSNGDCGHICGKLRSHIVVSLLRLKLTSGMVSQLKKTRTISEINYREISNGSLNTIQNHLFHIQRIKKSIQMYW